MATITSSGSGNWSSTSTWVGGVLPGVADDVVIADNHIIAADVDITVLSIKGRGEPGGALRVTTNRTITCTGDGVVNTANGAGSNNTVCLIDINGAGISVNITARLTGSQTNGAGARFRTAVRITNAGSFTLIGNCKGGQSDINGANAYALIIIPNIVVNITGNIEAGGLATLQTNSNAAIAASSNGNNTIGTNTSTINVTGNVTGIGIHSAILGYNVNVIGTILAATSQPAIVAANEVCASTPITNVNSTMAISSARFKLLTGYNFQWLFQTTAPSDVTLYSSGPGFGYPLESEVEDGVIYGASNELEGTLIATPALTAASFLAELESSTVPVAVRLRNCATVQSVGAALEAFKNNP